VLASSKRPPTPRGALKARLSAASSNLHYGRLGILHYERHSIRLATPFPMECCNGPQRAFCTICGGARGNLFWILHQALIRLPRFRIFLPSFSSFASSWCDRRFTFHILGKLLLSLQRYYTKNRE
jgi:hypothetical protein